MKRKLLILSFLVGGLVFGLAAFQKAQAEEQGGDSVYVVNLCQENSNGVPISFGNTCGDGTAKCISNPCHTD